MRKFIHILIISWLPLQVYSQEFIANEKQSKVVIKGTSSLHDWEADVTQFQIQSFLDFTTKTGKATATFQSRTIKSGKSIMDGKIQEALLAQKHPEIKFEWKDIKLLEKQIQVAGLLSIAGQTKPVSFKLDYNRINSKELLVQGTHSIKMTDFAIEPPTAMMGTLKTGDEVTLSFNLRLQEAGFTSGK